MKTHKLTAALIILTGVVVGSGLFYGGGSFAEEALTVTSGATGGDLLGILSDLQQIKLDGTIFTDPVFQNLTDFSVEIPPEPISRPNPFLPIGQDVGSASSAPAFIMP